MGSMLSRGTLALGTLYSLLGLELRIGSMPASLASMLSPNCVIAKDVKSCTYCCYVRYAILIVRVGGNALALNRRNSLPCTVRISRQGSCNKKLFEIVRPRAFGPAKRSGPRLLSTVP